MSHTRVGSNTKNRNQQKKKKGRGRISRQSELTQGQLLLGIRRKIAQDLRSGSRLIEGLSGSREPIYRRSAYRGQVSEIQMPVDMINDKEMIELKERENAFNTTLKKWGVLHDAVVKKLVALPAAYTACTDGCTQEDQDLKRACQFGCKIKQYAVKGDTASRNLWLSEEQYRVQPNLDQFGPAEIARLQMEDQTRGELRHAWATLVEKGCYRGIDGTEPSARCQGWQSTKGPRSGFYHGGVPLDGGLERHNCNVVISNNKAGYCVCKDGRKVAYADSGANRPAFNCNVMCSAENKGARGIYKGAGSQKPNVPLYSDPGQWPKMKTCRPCPPMRWWNDKSRQKNKCRTGVGQRGGWRLGEANRNIPDGCCEYTEGTTPWAWAWWWWWRTRVFGSKCEKALKSDGAPQTHYCPTGLCATAAEAARSPVNNINSENIKALPTLPEDEAACRKADYDNLYLDLRNLYILERELEQIADDIGLKVERNANLANKMATYGQEKGTSLLDHLEIYESVHRRYRDLRRNELNVLAMSEDGQARVGSVRITYSIWLVLAISTMLLAIRHLRK